MPSARSLLIPRELCHEPLGQETLEAKYRLEDSENALFGTIY
jgi:hypothetical protein